MEKINEVARELNVASRSGSNYVKSNTIKANSKKRSATMNEPGPAVGLDDGLIHSTDDSLLNSAPKL